LLGDDAEPYFGNLSFVKNMSGTIYPNLKILFRLIAMPKSTPKDSLIITDEKEIEKQVTKLYNNYTKQIVSQLGNGVTYTTQLSSMCNHLFKNKYKGTFSSDTLPKLSKSKPYAIVNVDTSKQPGSHWIACCHTQNRMLIYDSFGRNTKSLMKNVYKKYKTIDSDRDAEQKDSEQNCGSRCISFLMVCDELGPDFARLI
jgi:hypothetical protein